MLFLIIIHFVSHTPKLLDGVHYETDTQYFVIPIPIYVHRFLRR